MQLLLSIRDNYLPPNVGGKFVILCALQDDNYNIITTGLTINATVVSGNPSSISIFKQNNQFAIGCLTEDNIIIQITANLLGGQEYVNYYSFQIGKAQYVPQVQQYQSMLNSEMPGEFLQNNALDTAAWAQGIVNIYNYINTTLANTYPNQSTNINWLYSLWSTTQPFYYLDNNFRYQDMYAFLRNLRVTCSLNPFDLAFHISKFCYLMTGNRTYVYVKNTRNTEPNPPANYTVYIFGASTGSWILGVNLLGINTILGTQPLYDVSIQAINFFIAKIYRSSRNYNVDYSKNAGQLGLTQPILNAYKGDPRLKKQYCIVYNPNQFTQADALINPLE